MVIRPDKTWCVLLSVELSSVVEMDMNVNNPRAKENCHLFDMTEVTVRDYQK